MHQRTHRTISLAILGLIAASSTIWFSTRAKAAANTAPEFFAFGMMGIASGQTARLNVVTAGVQDTITVELLFLDSQANIVARSVEKVVPGRAVLLELKYATIPPPINDRVPSRPMIRAMVRMVSPFSGKGYIIPTMEMVDDTTGRTFVAWANPEG